MDFSKVKALSISEGVVEKITCGGKVLWQVIKAKYTNQIPISTDANGNIYNGKGYKERYYMSNGTESANNTTDLTGFIPCKVGDVIRLKNMPFNVSVLNCRLTLFGENKNFISQYNVNSPWYMDTVMAGVKDANGNYIQWTVQNRDTAVNCKYIRISAADITDESIVTINEEIT